MARKRVRENALARDGVGEFNLPVAMVDRRRGRHSIFNFVLYFLLGKNIY